MTTSVLDCLVVMRRLLALALLVVACSRTTPPPRTPAKVPPSGTCASSCLHYYECKGTDPSSDDLATCARECEKGPTDQESLRAFETMDCVQAVRVIEGDPS